MYDKSIDVEHRLRNIEIEIGSLQIEIAMVDYSEYLQTQVKCLYKDFQQEKIARGILDDWDGTHVKIKGQLGTIVIHKDNIQVMKPQGKGRDNIHI